MKPYPYIEDSGIRHAEDWENYRWGLTGDRPTYRVGLTLRPKHSHTGCATIFKENEDGTFGVITDFGNILSPCSVEELDYQFEVVAECGDGVAYHIKHQINKLTEFLEELKNEGF